MKLPRLFTCRRSVAVLVAIPLVPLVLWGAVLCLAPTDWARTRLVRELEAATGRKVAIGSIRLGPLGSLRIRDVQIAEADNVEDPWMRVAEARLDLHLIQMLGGCCKTTKIDIDGLDLRVHRRADGTLEFADLLKANAKKDVGEVDAAVGKPTILLTLKSALLSVIDDPTDTFLQMVVNSASASWTGEQATITSLKGEINGGTIECAATYNRYPSAPAFDAEFRATGVSLSGGMKALGLLVPVLCEGSSAVDGKVDLELALRGKGADLVALKTDIKGRGAIRINPIDLSRSKLLDSLDELRRIPVTQRVGSIESDFTIDSGRVNTSDLTIKVVSLPIILGGWSDFDGKIDYQVKSEAIHDRISQRLSPEARAIFKDVKDELGDLADIRIQGTVDAPKLIIGKRILDGKSPGRDDTEARLREAARRLGQKYLR